MTPYTRLRLAPTFPPAALVFAVLAGLAIGPAAAGAAEASAAIRPFTVAVPEATLIDLRQRVRATRWPAAETVADQSQGVQLARLQALVRYWGRDYDWVTNTAISSAHLYWENDTNNFHAVDQKTAAIAMPVAVTVFPGEICRAPKTWTARAYRNLIYFNEVDKGGHFAAWEQPELFAAELRAAFRSLRKSS